MAPTPATGLFAQLNALASSEFHITKALTFRPVDFKVEFIVITVAFVFLLLHAIGKARNRSLANGYVSQIIESVESQFATTAKDGDGKGQLLLWNGGQEAVLYASGRRGVESLHALFHLAPRNDPFLFIYQFLSDIALASSVASVRDVLTLSFALPTDAASSLNHAGVFAIVDKGLLQSVRAARSFDLSFARLVDSNDPREARGLDPKWAILSEHSELTDALLGPLGQAGDERRQKIGVQQVLNSEAGKFLESIVLTDLPATITSGTTIASLPATRSLIFTLRLPSSTSGAQASLPLFHLATNLLDLLDFPSLFKLSNGTLNKIRRSRIEFDQVIEKEKASLRKEEEEEARQKEKKERENKKLANLSEKDQAKRKALEEKRSRRKAAGKVQTRA